MIHIKHCMKLLMKEETSMIKLKRPVALFLSVAVILAGSILIWVEYGQKKTQQSELVRWQKQLEIQKNKNKALQDELTRLANPEYAKHVEISKYSLSNPKEGEYVFVLPNEGN